MIKKQDFCIFLLPYGFYYPDFIKERVYALYDAVYWWNEYGSECLKGSMEP
jgi:hypothetical protein